MLVVDRSNCALEFEKLGIKAEWRERDFVKEVRAYTESILSKVLLVSGLRGTGKSVGVLQAVKDLDFVYVRMDPNEDDGAEVEKFLRSRSERVVALDEYTWAENRRNLDAFLYTMVGRGKRVIITGTESLVLEALKAGPLIHRAITVRTTHMAFPEYCRLWGVEDSQRECDEYLKRGSVFPAYVEGEGSLMSYVESAIIANLLGYAREHCTLFDKTNVPNIVYTLLYRAIWDLLRTDPKLLRCVEEVDSSRRLERLGIDCSSVDRGDLGVVAEMLEAAGVLTIVPNLLGSGSRTYVTSPFITYQFVKFLFPGLEESGSLMGFLYEANCMVDMCHHQLETDKVYYVAGGKADNFEVDIVVVGNADWHKKQFYLIECKHSAKINAHGVNWSVLNGRVEDALLKAFPDSEIGGRFIVHPGEESWQTHKSGREVAVVKQGEHLYKYYRWEKLRDELGARSSSIFN